VIFLRRRLRKLRAAVARVKARIKKLAGRHPSGVSLTGLKWVSQWEGWYPTPYNDPAGYATIGYGHLLGLRPVSHADHNRFPRPLTKEEGLQLLLKDLAVAASAIRDNVKVPLTQAQFDALSSWAFNVGASAAKESTLIRRLNRGEYSAVPFELSRWTLAGGQQLPGLVRRREAEGRLFAHGY
jgi:lysozyme